MDITQLILNLFTLPKTAVFAFINDFDKRVYVSYSTTFKTRLMGIIEQISTRRWKYKGMINELSKLKVVILDKNLPEHELKLFTKYHRDYYRNLGYRFYNSKEKVPLQYSFTIRFTDKRNSICVVALTTRREPTIIGWFETLEEAQSFLALVTDKSLNPTRNLVYARNRSTRTNIVKIFNLAVKRYIR
jgi:hypothetical protein